MNEQSTGRRRASRTKVTRWGIAVSMAAALATSAFIIAQQERLALTTDSGALIFDVASVNGSNYGVQIGRGGDAVSSRADTDLIVYDPFFVDVTNPKEPAFSFNASISDLTIGSGDLTNSGDDGDVLLENGLGRATIHLDGAGTLASEIVVGATTQAGDIELRDTANATTILMNGQTGNVTNTINGDGLVKAWARININGTVLSCFRCNTSGTETRRLGVGFYEVDFTPLSTNVRSRPRSAVIDTHFVTDTPPNGGISLADRSGDESSVLVRTTGPVGGYADRQFTVIIY